MAITILREKAVCVKTGLPRSTLRLRVRQGVFPKPIKLGGALTGWPESEVDEVLDARVSGASDELIRSIVRRIEADRLDRRAKLLERNHGEAA